MNERSFVITATGPGGEKIRLVQGETEHREMIANALTAGIKASQAIEEEEPNPNFRVNPASIPDSLLTTN